MKKAINLKTIMEIEKRIEKERRTKEGMKENAQRYWDRAKGETDSEGKLSFEAAAKRYEGLAAKAEENIKKYAEEREEERSKILNAINEVQGNARARVLYVQDILREVENIENKLGLPKKYMEGVKFWCDPNAQEFPSAYIRYGIPESTHFCCEFKNGSWRIIDITREKCTDKRGRIKLTERATLEYLERQMLL